MTYTLPNPVPAKYFVPLTQLQLDYLLVQEHFENCHIIEEKPERLSAWQRAMSNPFIPYVKDPAMSQLRDLDRHLNNFIREAESSGKQIMVLSGRGPADRNFTDSPEFITSVLIPSFANLD